MAFVSPTNSAAKLAGYREWTDRLLELLAEADAGRANGGPRPMLKALAMMSPVEAAKGDVPHGWDAIIAAVMDPARLRSVARDDQP